MDTAVRLVETYLRLNGYFTVTEFQVQQPSGQLGRFETATDLDIVAVRLPHAAATVLRHRPRPGEPRCEILLADDPALGASRTTADVLIGEVKEGAGEINRGLLKTEVLRSALRRCSLPSSRRRRGWRNGSARAWSTGGRCGSSASGRPRTNARGENWDRGGSRGSPWICLARP